MAELIAQEAAIVRALGAVWNDFLALPVEHAQDAPEFCEGIHRLQEKVLARAGRRELNRADGVPAAPDCGKCRENGVQVKPCECLKAQRSCGVSAQDALRAILADPVIDGMSARIRNQAADDGRPNPLELARTALGVPEPVDDQCPNCDQAHFCTRKECIAPGVGGRDGS